jgi:hypothetical protein
MSGSAVGGINIAMKVPTHQYEAVVAFYRDVLKLPELEGGSDISFAHGPNRLWIDNVPHLSQAELWLELVTPNFDEAAGMLEGAGVARNDAIEPLPNGETFRGGWFFNPAGIVHLLKQSRT